MSKYYEKIIHETLKETGIPYRVNAQGTHAVLLACPVCSQKNKFFADLRDGRFICHNCVGDGKNIKGGLTYFVSLCRGETYEESQARINSGRTISKLFSDSKGDGSALLEKVKSIYAPNVANENNMDCYDFPEIKLPPHAIKMEKGSPAYRYLHNVRNISEAELAKLDAYEVPASSTDDLRRLAAGLSKEKIKEMYAHSGRVIFVQKVLGKIVGYISRDYTGKRDKKNKVLNSVGSWRQYCLWNWDRVKNSDRLIVTEGIISAMFCGEDATATYGNNVSNQQVSLMLSSKAKEVVIMVEVGAEINAYKLAFALMAHKIVKMVFLPKEKTEKGDWKDCANYTVQENLDLIESTPYADEYEIAKKMKEIVEQGKKKPEQKGKKDRKNYRMEKAMRLMMK
ncbi:hypothetical protein [Bdellovibrio sp. BCCA]|uniref:hypothetical protein n=1 Tax=Bdellovibrio sp. BCCA TaxID=3136281 RepID=UPI0030F1CDDC